MYVKDYAITINWDLEKTPNFASYPEDYFDLQITDPDGNVTYAEGSSNWATDFQQPTDEINGYITYNYTFNKEGVWVIILGNGVATNFDILETTMYMVVTRDTEATNVVHLA